MSNEWRDLPTMADVAAAQAVGPVPKEWKRVPSDDKEIEVQDD